MANWYMAAVAQNGKTITGKKQNITDVVLDTAGEEEFNANSSAQDMAAEALAENEYGGNGIYWTE